MPAVQAVPGGPVSYCDMHSHRSDKAAQALLRGTVMPEHKEPQALHRVLPVLPHKAPQVLHKALPVLPHKVLPEPPHKVLPVLPPLQAYTEVPQVLPPLRAYTEIPRALPSQAYTQARQASRVFRTLPALRLPPLLSWLPLPHAPLPPWPLLRPGLLPDAAHSPQPVLPRLLWIPLRAFPLPLLLPLPQPVLPPPADAPYDNSDRRPVRLSEP